MKRFIARSLFLGILLTLVSATAWAWRVNDHIDRCFDDSSSAYIADDAMRLAECGE